VALFGAGMPDDCEVALPLSVRRRAQVQEMLEFLFRRVGDVKDELQLSIRRRKHPQPPRNKIVK
jgi:hypothetical protein